MPGSLGCTEWGAEEDVLSFHVGEWTDCRELCLESVGAGVLGSFTGGKKQ